MFAGQNTARLLASSTHIPLLGPALVRLFRKQLQKMRFRNTEAIQARDIRNILGHIAGYNFSELARIVPAISQPTLVAFAEDDHMVEAKIPEALLAALPKGVELRFPTGGHNIQKTHAHEVAQAIGALFPA